MLGSPKILPHPPDPMLAVVDDALSFVRVGGDLEQEAVVPEVLRKSGSARCREDNFSRLIA